MMKYIIRTNQQQQNSQIHFLFSLYGSRSFKQKFVDAKFLSNSDALFSFLLNFLQCIFSPMSACINSKCKLNTVAAYAQVFILKSNLTRDERRERKSRAVYLIRATVIESH